MERELSIAGEVPQALLPPRQRQGAGFEAVGAMRFPAGPSGETFSTTSNCRTGALAEDAHGPATTMTGVNRVLARRAIAARYATGFYGVLASDGRFISSNAGHNPPIVVRRDGTVRRLEKGGTPRGLFAASAFEEEEIALTPGDTLLLFSDGLSEAENSDLREFGEDRLIALMTGEHHREPDILLEFLLAAAREFAGSQPQSDDITALIIRCPAE